MSIIQQKIQHIEDTYPNETFGDYWAKETMKNVIRRSAIYQSMDRQEMNRLDKIEADIAEIKRQLKPTQRYVELIYSWYGNSAPLVHNQPTKEILRSLNTDVVVYHKKDIHSHAPEVWFFHRPSGAFHFVCAPVCYYAFEKVYHVRSDFQSDLVRDRFIETFCHD